MYARGQMLLPTYQRLSVISLSVLFWHYVLQQSEQIPGFSLFNKYAKVVVTAFVSTFGAVSTCDVFPSAGTSLLACSDAGSLLHTPVLQNKVDLE